MNRVNDLRFLLSLFVCVCVRGEKGLRDISGLGKKKG